MENYGNRYVVFAKGALIATADSFEEACRKREALAPDALHFLAFPTTSEPMLERIRLRCQKDALSGGLFKESSG